MPGQALDAQLPPVPATVSRDTVQHILQLLELDPDHVLGLRLGLREVTVTLSLHDRDGSHIPYGTDVATTVVHIPIA